MHAGLAEAAVAEARCLSDYYEAALQRHHRDEERALFPVIVNRSFLIDGMVERLALDHDEIEVLWSELGPQLRRAEGVEEPKQLARLAHRYEKLLREHIFRENEDFFPKLMELLNLPELQVLGSSMQRLRQSGPAEPPFD